MARLDASSTSRSAPLVLLSTSVLVVRIKTSDLSPVDWSPDMEICRQDPAQEDLRACGAREAQPVQEGLLGQVTRHYCQPRLVVKLVTFQSARQRGEEDRGQDHWKEGRSMQEAAKGDFFLDFFVETCFGRLPRRLTWCPQRTTSPR